MQQRPTEALSPYRDLRSTVFILFGCYAASRSIERSTPRAQALAQRPGLSLGPRGESPAAFDGRCIPPGVAQAFRPARARLKPCPTTLSSVEYYRHAPSSRLARRAHRPSRCDAGLSPRAVSLSGSPRYHHRDSIPGAPQTPRALVQDVRVTTGGVRSAGSSLKNKVSRPCKRPCRSNRMPSRSSTLTDAVLGGSVAATTRVTPSVSNA